MQLRCAFLAVSLCAAAAGGAQAQVVNVQLINVCDDNGANCALSNPYLSNSYSPTLTPLLTAQIFQQAGVTVNLLSPVQFNSSAYLNPAVIDDPSHGYTTGSPTDPAHQLLSVGGHRQNTDPNVLDVYVVNTLPHNPNADGVQTGSNLFGIGLENSNGAIVTTGATPPDAQGKSFTAGLDNIAHELGHNLGLLHVDNTAAASPYNLMQGSGRILPQTICGIAGVICDNGTVVDPSSAAGLGTGLTTGLKDALNSSQITQVQSAAADLFGADGANAYADTTIPNIYMNSCVDGSYACAVAIGFNQNSSSESLSSVVVRFMPNNASADPSSLNVDTGMDYFPLAACGAQFTKSVLTGNAVELGATFAPGCFTGPLDLGPDGTGIGGDVFSPLYYLPVVDPDAPSDYDLSPFSIQFTFADGTTTTSLFNSSGTATSDGAVAVGNVLTANQAGPGLLVPTDPASFNALSFNDDEPSFVIRADGTAVPLFSDAASVPEPGSASLLGLGTAALAFRSRRRVTRGSRCRSRLP